MWCNSEASGEPLRHLAPLELMEFIQQIRSPCYIVTEAARDEAILEFIQSNSQISHCLYSGNTQIRLARYAPYLFRADLGDPAIRRFINDGWGESWYILLSSRSHVQQIVTQLRKSLIVSSESGKDLYFRFYDPRVLRSYLPLCTQDDLSKLMGESIETLFCETHDAMSLFRCECHILQSGKHASDLKREYKLSQSPLIEHTVYG
jgi:hypothetical protein